MVKCYAHTLLCWNDIGLRINSYFLVICKHHSCISILLIYIPVVSNYDQRASLSLKIIVVKPFFTSTFGVRYSSLNNSQETIDSLYKIPPDNACYYHFLSCRYHLKRKPEYITVNFQAISLAWSVKRKGCRNIWKSDALGVAFDLRIFSQHSICDKHAINREN